MAMFEIEKRLAVRSVRLKVGHKQVFVAGLMGYPEKGTGGQY